MSVAVAVGVPRVTVVVPVHNAGPFLAPALDSLLAQTSSDWEAVVIDDCSSDGSAAIAARYAREHPGHIVAVALERNVGVAAARNKAIAASHGGELVVLLDHDDRLRANYVEHMTGRFDAARAAGRRVGVVACDAELVGEDGQPLGGRFSERFGWVDDPGIDDMIQRNYVLARALFSRAAYDEVGGFDPACLASDDCDLWMRMLEAGYEIVTTREPVAIWRLHEASQGRNDRLMADGNLRVLRGMLQRGALTRVQRRAVRVQIRHYRALRARALVREARDARRPAAVVAGRALGAVPLGVLAFAQAPSRWGEWARDAVAALRRPASP